MAISVPVSFELGDSDDIQPSGSSEPQTSDSGQIQLHESMVDDSSEVYAFLCCLCESVFEKRNTHQPIHRNRMTGLPKLKKESKREGEELWGKTN